MHVYPRIYVLIDKRGRILEKNDFTEVSLHQMNNVERGVQVPGFTIWRNRRSAEAVRQQLRERMTAKAWKTWDFKVYRYDYQPRRRTHGS